MKSRAAWIAVLAVAGLVVLAAGWSNLTAAAARYVENRLGEQTGLAWRVGGVGLGTGPSLVLDEVSTTTGGGRPSIGAARIRLSGPFALLAGGAGAIRLRAEDVRLRLPLDPPALPAPGHADAKETQLSSPRRVAARLQVSEWALSQDGASLSASLPLAELDVDLGEAAAGAYRIEVSLPGQRLALTLDPPGAGAGRAMTASLAPDDPRPGGPRAEIRATLRQEGGRIALSGIAGTIDGASLSGEAACDLGGRDGPGKPRVTADLRLDALRLAIDGAAAGETPGLTVSVPSDALPDPRWFAPFEAQGRLAVGRLVIGRTPVEGVTVAATVKQGVLDATVAVAQAYDGTLKARYGLAPVENQGRHRLTLALTHARLRPLLVDLLGIGALDGRATASLDLQAIGDRPDALAKTASGSADVTLVEGGIDGADLAALVAGVTGQDEAGTATRFDYLGGRLRIGQGRATTEDLALRSPLVEASGSGKIDLAARTLDLTFLPTVVPRRGRRPGSARTPSVPVRVAGPWSDPAVSADMSGLLRDPAGTIEALQDLGSGLLGGGPELGGFLDALIPKQRQDAPPARRR